MVMQDYNLKLQPISMALYILELSRGDLDSSKEQLENMQEIKHKPCILDDEMINCSIRLYAAQDEDNTLILQQWSNLNLIQQHNVPENQIVDAYRRSDIDGKIELDRTRKSLESELEKLSKARGFVEANNKVLDDARKFGYGEDYADVAHSLVGMDEKAAKEYCSRIRDSHLSEYLDKNIRDRVA